MLLQTFFAGSPSALVRPALLGADWKEIAAGREGTSSPPLHTVTSVDFHFVLFLVVRLV